MILEHISPFTTGIIVVVLHASALALAVSSAKAKTDIVGSALLISAALATLIAYAITTLYL